MRNCYAKVCACVPDRTHPIRQCDRQQPCCYMHHPEPPECGDGFPEKRITWINRTGKFSKMSVDTIRSVTPSRKQHDGENSDSASDISLAGIESSR